MIIDPCTECVNEVILILKCFCRNLHCLDIGQNSIKISTKYLRFMKNLPVADKIPHLELFKCWKSGRKSVIYMTFS